MRHATIPAISLTLCLSIGGATESPAVDGNSPPVHITATHSVWIHRVLDEAAALGLTVLPSDAEFWYEDRAPVAGIDRVYFPHVHARLPDGRWLIDLMVCLPESAVAPERRAGFTRIGSDLAEKIGNTWGYHVGVREPLLLIYGMRLGDPRAQRLFHERSGFRVSPQERRLIPVYAQNDEDYLRLGVAQAFLRQADAKPVQKERWYHAAVTILPIAYRAGLQERLERRGSAAARKTCTPLDYSDPPPGDPWEALTRGLYRSRLSMGTGYNHAPAVDDDTLVALLDDRRVVPEGEGIVLGDLARQVLDLRWGFDPLLAATNGHAGPWDDQIRSAAATEVRAWWAQHRQQTVPMRFASVIARASFPALTEALDRRRRDRYADLQHSQNLRCMTPVDYLADDFWGVITPALAQRLRQGPGEATWRQIGKLLGYCSDRPELVAAIATWPRTGRWEALLAQWDDAHGQPDALNRLMDAWWQDDPRLTTLEAEETGPYFCAGITYDTLARRGRLAAGWVAHPTPQRWQRMRDGLAGERPAGGHAEAFAFGCGAGWLNEFRHDSEMDAPAGLQLPLAWIMLADRRPLPMHLRDTFPNVTPAADARWCDLTLAQICPDPDGIGNWNSLWQNTGIAVPNDILARPLAERDAAIQALLSALAPHARMALDHDHLDIPAELAACTTAAVTTPGLLSNERHELEQVLTTATDLGFPDLARAVVHAGPCQYAGPKGAKRDVGLIHLADSSWLDDSGVSLPNEAIVDAGAILSGPTTEDAKNEQRHITLHPTDRVRADANAIKSSDDHDAQNMALFRALAWWRSGGDADGRALVTALLATTTGPDTDFGGAYVASATSLPALAPALAVGLRRHIVAWFRGRALWAVDRGEAVRWIEAARALVDSSERAAWEPSFQRMLQRHDLPQTANGKDLVSRLLAWDESRCDPRTGRDTKRMNCPASRADTAALIALLDDDRPCRWCDDGFPRTLGDNALRALNEIWHVDWRLIACHDPMVAQALHARRATVNTGGIPPQPWTATQRHLIAESSRRWWQDESHHRPDAITAATIPWMPMDRSILDNEWLAHCGPLTDDIGNACAEVLRQQPLPRYLDWRIPNLVLHFPRNAAMDAVIATWPTTNSFADLRALRATFAAGGTACDTWFDQHLGGDPFTMDWTRAKLHPLANLGLLTTTTPTIARRDRLVALLREPSDSPIIAALLTQVGRSDFDSILGRSRDNTSLAIPAAMALAGLDDQRPLPALSKAMRERIFSTPRRILTQASPERGHRLCDVVAANVISIGSSWFAENWPLPGVDKTFAEFLARPTTERDRMITTLKNAMTDVAREAAEKAGWTTATPEAGNRF